MLIGIPVIWLKEFFRVYTYRSAKLGLSQGSTSSCAFYIAAVDWLI
jgi:hypothetical protein